jgi:prevent-host-death family protein
MQISIYEAKAKLSELIGKVEEGEEVVLARRRKPVARIVPVSGPAKSRIGGLAGRPLRMGPRFDEPEGASALADDFGVPKE